MTAAAAALPGSGVGTHYESYAQEHSPTHAALVNRAAEQDGINPYTSRPLSHHDAYQSSVDPERQNAPREARHDYTLPEKEQYQLHQEHHHLYHENYTKQRAVASDTVLIGGGAIGGSALGAAGYEAYKNRREDKQRHSEAQVQREIEAESAAASAPQTSYIQQQQEAKQAAYNATLIAAPDVNDTPKRIDTFMMAGGRSQGDISANLSTTEVSAIQQVADEKDDPTANSAKEILDPLAADLARGQPFFAAGQDHSHISSISQLHIPGSFA